MFRDDLRGGSQSRGAAQAQQSFRVSLIEQLFRGQALIKLFACKIDERAQLRGQEPARSIDGVNRDSRPGPARQELGKMALFDQAARFERPLMSLSQRTALRTV